MARSIAHDTWRGFRFGFYLVHVALRFRKAWQSPSLQRFNLHQNLIFKLAGVYVPLYTWLEYCQVPLETVLSAGTQDILELFVLYVKAVDSLIDSSAGRSAFLADPTIVKNDLRFAQIISALVELVREADTSPRVKRQMLSTIHAFRVQAIQTCTANALQTLTDQPFSLASFLAYREATSGFMYQAFAQLLNLRHDVPTEKGLRARTVVAYWGLAAQIIDDLGDVQTDYGADGNNMLWAVLTGYPEERTRLSRIVSEDPNFSVARLPDLCPQAYEEVVQLMKHYLQCIRAADPESRAAQRIAERLGWALESLSSKSVGVLLSQLATWASGRHLT